MIRGALTCLAVLVFAAPVDAQIVGIGEYRDGSGSQLVAEVALATALGPFAPNVLLTFDLNGDGRPVIQPQIGTILFDGFSVDAGFSAGPSDYTEWEPHFAVTNVAYLIGSLGLAVTFAWQPWNGWARSSVVKFNLTL